MKKTTYFLMSLYIISIVYGAVHYFLMEGSFLLNFLNCIGAFSIALFIIALFLLLSGFGYFDVFGYTFKKTYLMFTHKHNKMNLEDKEKYNSYHDYTLYKIKNRYKPQTSTIIYIFVFVGINLILSYVYAYAM